MFTWLCVAIINTVADERCSVIEKLILPVVRAHRNASPLPPAAVMVQCGI